MLLFPVAAQAAAHPAKHAAAPLYSGGAPYRHGAVPFVGHQHASGATSANDLNYGGGISGVGVTTGPERVYLVFWGTQWGTQGTDGSGYATFTGDPQGMAPRLQAFFKGLGTGSETWSGVMTQYCQGVAVGAQSCPSTSAHVGYPTGGALAGVWEDTSAVPGTATGHQIGTEAVNAATHFGNTTQSSNLNAQYVIVFPTGTNPDGYQTNGFCAWHDYTGDSTLDGGGAVSSPDGTLAFTNLPYLTDAGASCGQNFVNGGTAGNLDGVTIVEGHEYAETVTDTYPAGGWTDSSGAENGDKCAWISSGQGASQNITLSTGTFPVQSTWANDFSGGTGGCEVSHPIVTNGGGNTVTVTNPGHQSSAVGSSVSLQIHASDSASGQTLKYSATGLPAGLTISSSSGLISGTPTTATTYRVKVVAKDTTGAVGIATFIWTVAPAGCQAKQLLGNPGFETGSAAPWTSTTGVINANGTETSHSGTYFAWLDGYGTPHTDTLAQTVSIPAGCTVSTFGFWLSISTTESTSSAVDTLQAQVVNGSGTVLGTLATFSNRSANNRYVHYVYNVASYAGQTVTLKFTGIETDTGGGTTNFLIDDTSLLVS